MHTSYSARPHEAFIIRHRFLLIALLILALLLFTSFSELSKVRTTNTEIPLIQNVDWTLNTTVQGVEFYSALSNCKGKSVVYLRLINKNSYAVSVSWKESFDTQSEKGVEGLNKGKMVTVAPGEVSETNCEKPSRQDLIIHAHQVNPTYDAAISKFTFKNISVSKS